MADDDRKYIQAALAVLGLAAANFPGNTDVKIIASGTNNGSASIPHYVLRNVLRKALEADEPKA